MYLQLDTRFNPFTYDELVKPLLHYKEAYDATEAAYSDLAMQTEAFRDMVNRENSPEAYEMFQRYSGDLNNAVEDFSRGMTASNRRALIGMKRRYASDISPIARASEAMKEANDFRAKAGPDAIFQVGQYNSLDDFLHGKSANNLYTSRDSLMKRAAAMSEAAMSEAMKDPEFKKAMGDQYWQIIQHTGGSYEDLMAAMKLGMADNPIAQNRFSQIRQELAKNAGIVDYDSAGQKAIFDAIDTGLFAGLDKPAISFQANQGYLNPLQAEQLRQLKSGSGGGGRGRGSGSSGDDDVDEEELYKLDDHGVYYTNREGKLVNASGEYDRDRSYQGAWVSYEQLGDEYRKIAEQAVGKANVREYQWRSWKPSGSGNHPYSPHVEYSVKKSTSKLKTRAKQSVGNNVGDMSEFE